MITLCVTKIDTDIWFLFGSGLAFRVIIYPDVCRCVLTYVSFAANDINCPSNLIEVISRRKSFFCPELFFFSVLSQ
jgi:hypothetical protein